MDCWPSRIQSHATIPRQRNGCMTLARAEGPPQKTGWRRSRSQNSSQKMRYARRRRPVRRRRFRGRRTGRRIYKRRAPRRMRRGSGSSNFITVSKRRVTENLNIATGAGSIVTYNTVLANIPDMANYIGMYQQYRIRKIGLSIKPTQNLAEVGGSNAKPVFESIIQKGQLSTPASMAEIQNSYLYRRGHSLNRSYRPQCDVLVRDSTGTANYSMMRQASWLSTIGINPLPADQPIHHGIAYEITLPPSATGAWWATQVEWFVVDFRYKR